MSFLKLAKSINQKGDTYLRRNGVKKFHSYAAGLLEDSDLSHRYNFQEVISSGLSEKNQKLQNYRHLEFSDLPVTIAKTENCFIDVYFWRRRPTVIHNHHFMGAFMCLEGNNVDLEFSFKKEKNIGKFFETGFLKLEHSRNITAGDVAPIDLLNKFIHQNHHQAELTVNLCFRTPDIGKINLSNYLYSGLKFEKNPMLISKVNRLRRIIDIGDFDVSKMDITLDDAVYFLIQNYGSESKHPLLLKTVENFRKKIKKESGLNIEGLMQKHEERLNELENEYE